MTLPVSFPRKRESNVCMLQRCWVLALRRKHSGARFAGKTTAMRCAAVLGLCAALTLPGHATNAVPTEQDRATQARATEIAEHLRSNPRQTFAPAHRSSEAKRRELGDSPALTLRRFREGKSVAEISQERGFVSGTILNHLGEAAEGGEEIDLTRFLTAEQESEIKAAFEAINWQNIVGARENDPSSPGAQLGVLLGVERAPFFVVRDDAGEKVYRSVLQLIQERFGESVSTSERARDVDPDDVGGI